MFRKKTILPFLFLLISGFSLSAKEISVDIAFVMDLSGSTNGLLNQFRDRYWQIVNAANSFQQPVKLRIGIIGYSRPSFGKKNLYVKVIQDLTDDFDSIAKNTFTIFTITDQGEQYVGYALKKTINKLSWSREPDGVRLVFLIGNGSAIMGGKDYLAPCKHAVYQDIVINTVWCRTYFNVKEVKQWIEISKLGRGEFYDIDVNKRLPNISPATGQDLLLDLNKIINSTYVYYGSHGRSRYKNLFEMDTLASQAGEIAFCERVGAKASAQFIEKNDSWDLVDLYLKRKLFWSDIDTALIPEKLRNMSDDERYKFISKKWEERRLAISKIRVLYSTWRSQTDEWKKNMKISEGGLLVYVVLDALHREAGKKGLKRKGLAIR